MVYEELLNKPKQQKSCNCSCHHQPNSSLSYPKNWPWLFCFYIHHDIDILLWSLRLSSSWLSLPPLHWGGEGWKVISTCQCTSSLFSSTLPSSSTLTSAPPTSPPSPPWLYECKTVLSSKRLLLSQIYLWHFSGLWLVSCKRLSSGKYIHNLPYNGGE